MRDLPSAEAALPVTKPSSDFEKLHASPTPKLYTRENDMLRHTSTSVRTPAAGSSACAAR